MGPGIVEDHALLFALLVAFFVGSLALIIGSPRIFQTGLIPLRCWDVTKILLVFHLKLVRPNSILGIGRVFHSLQQLVAVCGLDVGQGPSYSA